MIRKVILSLLDEDIYDVMGAIRGPDSTVPTAHLVKNLTTAVIRYFTFDDPDAIGGSVYSPEEAKKMWRACDKQSKEACRKFLGDDDHFTDHVEAAFDALPQPSAKEYRLWLHKVKLLS